MTRQSRDERRQWVDVQADSGFKRSSTDSSHLGRRDPPAQRTRPGPGRVHLPGPPYAREQPPPRPAHLRGREATRPSSSSSQMQYGLARPSSREPGPSTRVQGPMPSQRRMSSPNRYRHSCDDERPLDSREYSLERSERGPPPNRSTSPTRRPQFGLAQPGPLHAPYAPKIHVGPSPAGRNGDVDDVVDSHHKPRKPRWKKGRPLPASVGRG